MDDFGSYLGSTFGRLGQQVASGVASHLDGVALSVGQALRERGIVGAGAGPGAGPGAGAGAAGAAGIRSAAGDQSSSPGGHPQRRGREEVLSAHRLETQLLSAHAHTVHTYCTISLLGSYQLFVIRIFILVIAFEYFLRFCTDILRS